MSQDPPSKSSEALQTWREKQSALENALAIASNEVQKFQFKKEIQECITNIQQLEAVDNPTHVITPLQNHVQVIGWKGVEEETLYDGAPVKPPACLVGMGTMDSLPKDLTFRQRLFDLIIADIEYVNRYHKDLERLQDLRATRLNVDKHWAELAPLIRRLSKETLLQGNLQLGVPIQFGFTEILINKELLTDFAGNGEEITYDALNVIRMLEVCKKRGWKIGFWDLYLPTLTHVLATTCPEITESLQQSVTKRPGFKTALPVVERLKRISEKKVADITKQIAKNRGYIKFLDNAYKVNMSFKDDKVAIVYGAGSSLILSDYGMRDKVIALVPQKFLFVWINCCAVLQGAMRSDEFPSLINYWLAKTPQEKLSFYGGYHGCPVTKEALMEIKGKEEHPAYGTLNKVVDAHGEIQSRYTLSIRTLPKEWRGWQKCWEEMKSKLK